jgi:hypothetical protein
LQPRGDPRSRPGRQSNDLESLRRRSTMVDRAIRDRAGPIVSKSPGTPLHAHTRISPTLPLRDLFRGCHLCQSPLHARDVGPPGQRGLVRQRRQAPREQHPVRAITRLRLHVVQVSLGRGRPARLLGIVALLSQRHVSFRNLRTTFAPAIFNRPLAPPPRLWPSRPSHPAPAPPPRYPC